MSALIVVPFGCDKLIDETGDFVAAPHSDFEPGCGSESESEPPPPHPYTSCTWPENPEDPSAWDYDPACIDGCGGMTDADGISYAWCNVECVDVTDCATWDPGGSAVTCETGRCRWYCDEDHPCPSDFACVASDTIAASTPHDGECWALDPLAP
jgi:hypothetical protein